MDVCVALAAGALLLRVPAPVTLHWRHSVEHFELAETYHVKGASLVLAQVRGRGLGAGIALPDDVRWSGRWWAYAPTAAPLPALRLANSRHGGGYRICWYGGCTALSSLPGARDAPLTLAAC